MFIESRAMFTVDIYLEIEHLEELDPRELEEPI